MNNAINELVRSIVKKNSLAECSVSELQRLTTQYPYFGPVQFLLARKLKEENSSQYAKQSQKAILYFQDDLWFDYVTSKRLNEVVFSKNTEQAKVHPIQPLMATKETIAETVENKEAVAEPSIEERPEPVQPVVHEKAPVEYDDGSSNSSQPEIKVVAAEHELPIESMDTEELNSEEEEITPVNTDLPPLPGLKIEPFNPATAKLTFEPYHTVDYFASLGIKFREEEKPKDKFGQQLKSFTEWLKSLKKAPEPAAGSAPTATGPEDKKVTQMAAHSLAEKDVVTEAMADVWEKQGNHEKAIETYRKLSLLNPSKSAYFAAKIDHLKQL
jgi:hypothetical protein